MTPRLAARWRAAMALLGWLACAGDAGAALPACRDGIDAVDAAVEAAGLRDGGAYRVPGAPVLRVDRGLAALLPQSGSPAFTAWARRARALDRAARDAEMRNLGLASGRRGAIERCAERLLAELLADPAAREAVARAAVVPDEYSLAARAAGLYPLTSLGLLAGVSRLRDAFDADFRQPLHALPVHGRLVRFVPPPVGGAARAIAQPTTGAATGAGATALALDALGVPAPDRVQLDALFERHAPVFEVDVVRPDDRIGRPFLAQDGEPQVDPARPVVYRRTGLARLAGRMRLQLEYWAWFRSRPSAGPLDVLAGPLDGLVWRVTVDGHGRALAYDSIHPCGCYHLVFPTPRLTPRPAPQRYEEPLLVPQIAPGGTPDADAPGRLVLRVAQRTHYLQRVYRDTSSGGVTYAWQHYDALRSLALPSGSARRSLFAPDGLVPVSERPERWLLWMSGVASPGAMRQAGRHAVAFVGRRHFDDPDLLDRFFTGSAP